MPRRPLCPISLANGRLVQHVSGADAGDGALVLVRDGRSKPRSRSTSGSISRWRAQALSGWAAGQVPGQTRRSARHRRPGRGSLSCRFDRQCVFFDSESDERPQSCPQGDGSQEREPAYSASLRLTATHSDCSRRWEAPRSTVSDVDRRTGSAWHARGPGFESP
jgi:hypothetical protein